MALKRQRKACIDKELDMANIGKNKHANDGQVRPSITWLPLPISSMAD